MVLYVEVRRLCSSGTVLLVCATSSVPFQVQAKQDDMSLLSAVQGNIKCFAYGLK